MHREGTVWHREVSGARRNILIVQGGLHHVPMLPDDLDRVFAKGARVLRENGLPLLIEPWVTLLLSMTHELCRSRVIRELSPKIDALASMIHYERQTYEN